MKQNSEAEVKIKVHKLENMKTPHDVTQLGSRGFQPNLHQILKRKSPPLWSDDHPISSRIDKSIMDLLSLTCFHILLLKEKVLSIYILKIEMSPLSIEKNKKVF